MTITSYADLIGEIGDHLASEELESKAPLFIQMAEARFNRKLDTLSQETLAVHILEQGKPRITIPNDFSGVLRMALLEEGNNTVLTYLTPQALSAKYQDVLEDRPRNFTIEGVEIVIGPTPDSAYTVEALYTRDLRSLSNEEGQTDNWLLRQAPDIYLYQSLVAAEGYLKNPETLVIWKRLVDEMIAELLKWDRDNRAPNVLVSQTDVPTAFIEHG